MIRRLMVNNLFGSVREFTLGRSDEGVLCKDITGLGPVQAELDTVKSVANGAHFLGKYVGTRNIVVNFKLSRYKNKSVEEIRSELYRFFRPGYGVDITINSEYKIGYVRGHVESVEPNIFDREASVQVSILAQPFFIDETIGYDTVLLPTNQSNATINYLGSVPNGIDVEIEVVETYQHLPTTVYFYETVLGPNQNRNMSFVMGERDIQNASGISGYKFTKGDILRVSTSKGAKKATLQRSGSSTEYNIIDSVMKSDEAYAYLPEDQWPELLPFATRHQFRLVGTDRFPSQMYQARVSWETLFEGY